MQKLTIGIYILGATLLFILFGFGALMKDGQASVMFAMEKHITGAVIDLEGENLDPFFQELSIYNKPNIVLALMSEEDVAVGSMKARFPDAKVFYHKLSPDAGKIDSYRLARQLHNEYKEQNGRILVVAGIKWPDSELSKVTIKRALYNKEIGNIDSGAVKAMFHFLNLNEVNNVQMSLNGMIYDQAIENSYVPEEITLLAFGDLMLDRGVRSLMNSKGMYYPFQKIAGPDNDLMRDIDFVFANLEGPIKEVYVPTSKSIAFRFKPDVAAEIKKTGINIVSLANNHALDQGWGGRSDTIKYLDEAGILYFGHPKNTLEDNVYSTQVGDQKIAFIGFDDTIFRIDPAIVNGYIKTLDEENDFVVISIHWGAEYKHIPTTRKKELAHGFVDNGADFIIGHHPHVVQTVEIYNDVPIFYSLGNFVFDQYFSVDTQEGLAIGVILGPDKVSIELYPFKIPHSQPQLMTPDESQRFLEKFVSWKEYDQELKDAILAGKIVVEKGAG